MRTGGPKGKCYPAVQAGCVVMVLMKKVKRDYWRPKDEISGALDDNFLKAKSWNKKLHDYEANMPDRWGHSGYKELYPEEFETDSSDQQDITNGKKTSPQVKSSTHESHKHKKSKKSHKKKQKKKVTQKTVVAKPDTFSMTRAGRKNVLCVRVSLLLLWQIKFHS